MEKLNFEDVEKALQLALEESIAAGTNGAGEVSEDVVYYEIFNGEYVFNSFFIDRIAFYLDSISLSK